MIYTTYFAKLRKLPENVMPIAICAKVPEWYKGAQYSKLAPDYRMLIQWKCDHNDDGYIDRFNKTVLDKLDIIRTTHELHMLLPDHIKRKMRASVWNEPNWHIALVCYEKPEDFCHRHLVSQWLKRHGYACEEWSESE